MVLSDLGVVHNFYLVNGARFGIMFAAGALIQQFQRLLPARWWLVGVAAIMIAGSAFLPDYRVIAALPLAYLLIAVGALVKVQRLRLENDVSYGTYIYAFPVQQVLACAGLSVLGVPLFAAVATALTLGLATLSWYGVEKPAMRLKNVLRRRGVVAAPAVPPGAPRPAAAVVLPAVDARPSVRPSVDS
jgi:peptidoglycan/LPS O-acetylase OafA/YrhL